MEMRERALEQLVEFFDELTGKLAKKAEGEQSEGEPTEEFPSLESAAPEASEETEAPSEEEFKPSAPSAEKIDVKKEMERLGRRTPKAAVVEMGFVGMGKGPKKG